MIVQVLALMLTCYVFRTQKYFLLTVQITKKNKLAKEIVQRNI